MEMVNRVLGRTTAKTRPGKGQDAEPEEREQTSPSGEENSQPSQTEAPPSPRRRAAVAATRSAAPITTETQSIARKGPSSRRKQAPNVVPPEVSDEDPAEEEEASEPEPVVKKTGRKHQAARKTAPPSKKRKIPEPEPEEEQEEEEDEIEEEEDELAPSQPVKAKKAAKAKPRVTAETNSEEATSIKIQLLPAKKGQQGEILDISVGDGILVNGKAGDHGRPGSYDDNVDMPYWIGIVLKIHRSKKPKGAANIDGEMDQKANLEVRWYFNPEELRFWGLNDPKIQKELQSFGNKEIMWSDYTQSKPPVPVGAVCGKCLILKYDDFSPRGNPLQELTETTSSMDTQGQDPDEMADRDATTVEAFFAGAGDWADDDHTFYYRTSLFGLGKNWKRNLANFKSNTMEHETKPWRLVRHCTCRKPYCPDDLMRQCASAQCQGTWYHLSCIVGAQDGLDRNLEDSKVEGLPLQCPPKVEEDLWGWAVSPTQRGGSEGLIGNLMLVNAARQLVLDFIARKKKDLSDWREDIGLVQWEERSGQSRFAGRNAKNAKDDPRTEEEWYCPGCGVEI